MKPKQLKNNWEKLRKCLETEVKLTQQCIKDAVETKNYIDANNMHENLATVEWVLDEMDAIETTGEAL